MSMSKAAKDAMMEEISIERLRIAYETIAQSPTEVRIAVETIKKRFYTEVRVARKQTGQVRVEVEKLERTIRDQQLEINRLKFRVAELETKPMQSRLVELAR